MQWRTPENNDLCLPNQALRKLNAKPSRQVITVYSADDRVQYVEQLYKVTMDAGGGKVSVPDYPPPPPFNTREEPPLHIEIRETVSKLKSGKAAEVSGVRLCC